MATLPSSSRGGTASPEKRYRWSDSSEDCGGASPAAEAQIEMGAGGIQNEREQLALRARARRQVERDHRLLAKLPGDSEARQFDARGVVGEAARGQLVLIGAEQQRQVRARFAALAELIERDRVEAQLFEGVGEGARKSGEGGDGTEVAQSAGADRLLRDARGQRFADDAAHRHERAAIQLGGGKFQDELAECQAVHADQGVAASFESDFVGGLAHRRQHQHRAPLHPLGDELRGARTQLGIAVHGAGIFRLASSPVVRWSSAG